MRFLYRQCYRCQYDSMKKKIVFLIVTLVLVAGAYSVYMYLYKDHRDIASETAVKILTAVEMQESFQNNTSGELLNKTVEVRGTITLIEDTAVTLDDKVYCSFENGIEGIEVGDEVRVKGRCIGYDDLFEIVKLDQSTLTY